eukprot:gene5853-4176_t
MRRIGVPQAVVAAATTAVASGRAAPTSTTAAVSTPARGIYTNFASIACEPWAKKESWLTRLMNQSSYRSFDFHHIPVATPPANLKFSSSEMFLLSAIENDTERLLNLSWAYDFDPYWKDAMYSHQELFNILYKGSGGFRRIFLGNYTHKTAEKTYVESKLNRLLAIYDWARITEEAYTTIYKTRFMMQRTIFNQLERERYLCGCVEMVEELRKTVPEELSEKVMGEIDLHLTNLRHWVNGCPVGKATFTRKLA